MVNKLSVFRPEDILFKFIDRAETSTLVLGCENP